MAADELGPWSPLTVQEVSVIFEPASWRWWFSGCHALELHLGRSWRAHDDIDVGLCRQDCPRLTEILGGWDVQVAADGRLHTWGGDVPSREASENNLWCRRGDGPWLVDITVGDGDDDQWVFRRDPTLRLAWDDAVLTTPTGLRYLAPELQLLFKSKSPRPKDDVDAAEVIPTLEQWRTARLMTHLPPDHPWREHARSEG